MIKRLKMFLYEENMKRLESMVMISNQINEYSRPSKYLYQLAHEILKIIRENNSEMDGRLIEEDEINNLAMIYEELEYLRDIRYDFEDISLEEYEEIERGLVDFIDLGVELINNQTYKAFEIKRELSKIKFDA